MIINDKDKITINYKKQSKNSLSIPLEEIHSRIYAQDKKFTIVAGSFVENLATSYSDLDVLVFCEEIPDFTKFDQLKHENNFTTYSSWMSNKDHSIWSTHEFINNSTLQLEITYIPINYIKNIIIKINDIFEKQTNKEFLLKKPFIGAGNLSSSEKEIIHRLLNCIPIENENLYEGIKYKISKEKFCFLCYLDMQVKYSSFKDILGLIDINSLHQAKFLLDRLIINLIQSFLHLYGSSNPKIKWALEIVRGLPEEFNSLKKEIDSYFCCENRLSIKIFEDAFKLMDTIFLQNIFLLDKNFKLTSRAKIKEIYTEAFLRKKTHHPEILKAHIFAERYYSELFKESCSFLKIG